MYVGVESRSKTLKKIKKKKSFYFVAVSTLLPFSNFLAVYCMPLFLVMVVLV